MLCNGFWKIDTDGRSLYRLLGLIAIAFRESGERVLIEQLRSFDQLVSSNLLEAEIRSTFAREGRSFLWPENVRIDWIFPDQTLSAEFVSVLRAGYLRGADLWHLATALYAAGESGQLHFITLDNRQRAVAVALGFLT